MFYTTDTLNEEYSAYQIKYTAPGYEGPREIEVGDSLDEVIESFCISESAIDNEETSMYGDDDKTYVIDYDDQGNVEGFYFNFYDAGWGHFNIIFEDDVVSSFGMELFLD